MEVCAEAKRVMVQALSKIYISRNQRGGIPLHRSLLLSLVMRSARDAYHSARTPSPGAAPSGPEEEENIPAPPAEQHTADVMDTTEEAAEPPCALRPGDRGTLQRDNSADKENSSGPREHTHSRKRRGKRGVEPDFLPCKKARLDPAPLRPVLHNSTAQNLGHCGRDTQPLSATHTLPRTIATC